MPAQLTKKELDIIEKTKKQGEELQREQPQTKHNTIKSFLVLIVVFLLFVVMAFLVFSLGARG